MTFAVTDNVLLVLAGIFSVLVVASLFCLALRIVRPNGNHVELFSRIKSWWIIVSIILIAFVSHPVLILLMFTGASFLALREYLSLIPLREADHRLLKWAYLAIPVQYFWVYDQWYGMFLIFIPVYMFLFLPLRMVLIGEMKGFLHAVSSMHWGLMITVFSLSHISYLLVLSPEGNPVAHGAGLVLYLILLTEANDVSQYIWGKLFGRHKVIPKVSPNKTWEGLFGGVATTIVIAFFLASVLTPFTPVESILVGLIVGFAGFIGDVTISAVKRDFGVKDTGTLLPGHGGILDRLDSLTFTAPLFFHFLNYTHVMQ